MMEHSTPSYKNKNSIWYPLYLLSFYRIAQIVMLVSLAPTPYTFGVLGKHSPIIYNASTGLYLVASILVFLSIRYIQQAFLLQMYLQFFIDALLISALLYASGGVVSGLSLILIFYLTVYCFISRGITPYFMAAVVSLSILINQSYIALSSSYEDHLYLAALHGAVFFAIAALTQRLVKRLDDSEQESSKRYIALGNLEQLNELIVNQVQHGLMVISQERQIVLYNKKIADTFNQSPEYHSLLVDFSSHLNDCLDFWLLDEHSPNLRINMPGNPYTLLPEFTQLKINESFILISIQDTESASKNIQTQKLKSLGRLTASMAHEIRNPLSAISHAAQLLKESETLSTSDARLSDIIQQQTVRVNTIVESILQLSKKNKSIPELIQLDAWLIQFKDQFCHETQLPVERFKLHVTDHLQAAFDKAQLHQVLWNLCYNSTKYGQNADGEVSIHINATDTGRYVNLRVYDEGAGISGSDIEHIFEPFYTSNTNKKESTGLGLFIAHELCSANQGTLEYIPRTTDFSWHFSVLMPTHMPTQPVLEETNSRPDTEKIE